MKRELFGGFPGGRFIGQEELDEVAKVIRARSPYRFYGLDLKRQADKLEGLCCRLFGRRYALALSSGTAALHAALFSLGVSKDDEVIMPAYAWIADLMAILALDAIPVVVPVDETLGLNPASLAKSITKRTKAIVAVHMRGYPCDLKRITEIGREYGVKIIEDGAQCIGGRIEGASVGSWGDVSVLSFQYNKLVTCGEGGLFLTDDKAWYERACRFHDLGMLRRTGQADPQGLDSVSSFGLNYRLSELQAAFLLSQLKKMPRILEGLKKTREEALSDILEIRQRFHLTERRRPSNTDPNYAFLCLHAETEGYADLACQALRGLEVPVQRCSRIDGHHFETWRDYMIREGREFRMADEGISDKILKRSLFIEINAVR